MLPYTACITRPPTRSNAKVARYSGFSSTTNSRKNSTENLARPKARGEGQTHGMKEAFARQLHLPVVHGKVSFPDLRIEYANQEMEISRVDLELATGHYHAGHLAEKARAGFQIYARSEDAAGLRRVRDDREIMTAILSL